MQIWILVAVAVALAVWILVALVRKRARKRAGATLSALPGGRAAGEPTPLKRTTEA